MESLHNRKPVKQVMLVVFDVYVMGWSVTLQTLLDLGASPNYRDSKGLTPLYHCMLNVASSAHCAQMLLHDHAEVGYRDTAGWTEVHQVCKSLYMSLALSFARWHF